MVDIHLNGFRLKVIASMLLNYLLLLLLLEDLIWIRFQFVERHDCIIDHMISIIFLLQIQIKYLRSEYILILFHFRMSRRRERWGDIWINVMRLKVIVKHLLSNWFVVSIIVSYIEAESKNSPRNQYTYYLIYILITYIHICLPLKIVMSNTIIIQFSI